MTLYKWSQTAGNNATADPSINWQEGQAPSSVNDSGRAMMASIAKHRDDVAGAIVTGGTATAYTVTSYEAFDTPARLNGQIIAFTPHVTNGSIVTLNVDSLGARPLRSAPSTELLAGTLIQGTPYVAIYNNLDAAFYLQSFFGNPYNVPLGAGLDYWGATAPNSAFVIPTGQAISRATYASLFSLFGTTYGPGDGSTTFNLPDKRGRISAAIDPTSGILNSFSMTPDGNTLGAKGGGQSVNLAVNQIPSGVLSANAGGIAVNVTGSTGSLVSGAGSANVAGGGNPIGTAGSTGSVSVTASGTLAAGVVSVTSTNASLQPVNKMPPTILCNYIMRVI